MTLRDFLAAHWGDVASLTGLALTIWAVLKAKKATEQARDAAQQVKERIAHLDTVAAVSAAITTLEEIKILHRTRAWDRVLAQYSTLRKHFVTIEAGLTKVQRDQVGRAFSQFRIIEGEVEQAMAGQRQDQIDFVTLNKIASAQIETLERVMIAIKQAGV
jgi:hypothetical protein